MSGDMHLFCPFNPDLPKIPIVLQQKQCPRAADPADPKELTDTKEFFCFPKFSFAKSLMIYTKLWQFK